MAQYSKYGGVGGAAAGDVTDNPTYATQAALTYYVATTGSDNNPGTEAAPFLTVQKAIDVLPKQIRHAVTINVGAGSFTGANITGFTVEQGGWIKVTGTLIASTITGLQTGNPSTTATTGSNATGSWGNLSVAGAGWTTDALRSKFVYISAGTGSGQIRAIVSNTNADPGVLTIPGAWATAPTTGSTFNIVEPGTIINTGATRAAQLDAAASANFAGFIVRDNICYQDTTASGIYIERFKFTSARSVQVQDSDAFVRYCWIAQSASNASVVVGQTTGRPSNVNVHDNYSNSAGVLMQTLGQFSSANALRNVTQTAAGLLIANSTGQATGGSILLSSNSVRGFTGEAIMGQVAQIFAQGNKFDAATAGASKYAYRLGTQASQTPVNGLGWFSISADDIINVGHGIHVSGGFQGVLLGVTGITGNTAGIEVQRGASVQINSAVTLTGGTTEISIDGTATTLAVMRAASPKAITDPDYGTNIFE